MIIEFWKTGENPITCYSSVKNTRESVTVPKLKKKGTTQAVTVEHKNGEKEEFLSVVDAAKSLNIKIYTLYNQINGKGKIPTEYQIYKSKINHLNNNP